MAAAEARAVWQRAAKRAPKLACSSSVSSVISKIDAKPVNPTDLDDSFSVPNETSFYTNSSDSKWWIQLQPDNMYQRGLGFQKSHQFVENQDDESISSISLLSSKESFEVVQMEVGSFVSNRSHCDLHGPMHTGSDANKIKCGQNAITRGGWQTDTSKRKVLEALCHSQTRAREAEIAAKKAHAEKEHAIKLLFRQASQLFAYRQWIYILQLENLCYQIKNKSGPISSVCAFSASKMGKLDKNVKKVAPVKRKRTQTRSGHWLGRYKDDLGEYVVVLMVGLGIVGAGLFLGWTVGWMLI